MNLSIFQIRAKAEPPLNPDLSTSPIGDRETIQEDLMYYNLCNIV